MRILPPAAGFPLAAFLLSAGCAPSEPAAVASLADDGAGVQSDAPVDVTVGHDEGWHPVERAASGERWRWTTGRAVLSFRNPRRPARLRLDVQGRPDLFDPPQSLSLVVGGRTLLEETLDTSAVVPLEYELTEAELGGGDVVSLELLVDRTFVPAEVADSGDTRELGVRVSGVSVEARGSADRGGPAAAPRLRVAWTRDVGDGGDVISLGERLVLMAYDSHDGRGERAVLRETAGYAKPLITPDGASIVFTIRRQNAVYAIDWDGTGLRRLSDGFGLDVWADPLDGAQWVYVGVDEIATDPPTYPVVRRHRLDDPAVSEVVWDARPVTADSFQLSADGRTAGALAPWPAAGVADLASGTWRRLGEGCWTAFSPGAQPLFWYFDGAHRNVTIVDLDTDERWQVPINGAPMVGGFEVYHPRWTNHPGAIVMTGPYTVGERANKIRGGGDQVEILVGFFDETLTAIASWRRVTVNDEPDFYPDAWIEPGTLPEPRRAGGFRPAADGPDAAASARGSAADAAGSELIVEVRARQDVALPTPASIAPYREGLLGLEYEVVEVVEGRLDAPVIAVAHWIIRDARIVSGAERPAGRTLRLALAPYDARPELEGKRLVLETTDLTLPLFYDVASAGLAP